MISSGTILTKILGNITAHERGIPFWTSSLWNDMLNKLLTGDIPTTRIFQMIGDIPNAWRYSHNKHSDWIIIGQPHMIGDIPNDIPTRIAAWPRTPRLCRVSINAWKPCQVTLGYDYVA